jgi:TolA-binding protein
MDPRAMPDLTKTKPSARPKFAEETTRLQILYDPKNPTIRKQLLDARQPLERCHVSVRVEAAVPEGLGKPSEEETQATTKLVRKLYPAAKRTEVAARLREAEEAEAKKKEEEKKKLAAAKEAETKKETGKASSKEPGKAAAANPDDVVAAAQEAYDKREFARALALFQKLAALAPGSDYERLAKKRIEELQGDPSVKRAVADAEAEKKARPMLALGRNFKRAGDLAKAAAEFEKVVAQFPDTSFAEDARQELKELREQK